MMDGHRRPLNTKAMSGGAATMDSAAVDLPIASTSVPNTHPVDLGYDAQWIRGFLVKCGRVSTIPLTCVEMSRST
jgi:hypothetical protein